MRGVLHGHVRGVLAMCAECCSPGRCLALTNLALVSRFGVSRSFTCLALALSRFDGFSLWRGGKPRVARARRGLQLLQEHAHRLL